MPEAQNKRKYPEKEEISDETTQNESPAESPEDIILPDGNTNNEDDFRHNENADNVDNTPDDDKSRINDSAAAINHLQTKKSSRPVEVFFDDFSRNAINDMFKY